MPIYEYRCSSCGAQVEILLRSSETDPVCPECGGSHLKKLISAANVMSGQTARQPGRTCCGREERCASPPCGSGYCQREE